MNILKLILAIFLSLQNLVFSQVPDQLNSRGIAFPEVRFRQYRWLEPEVQTIVDNIGYTNETWDQIGTAPFENLRFEDLGIMQTKIQSLGITQDQWDCYIVHYLEGYTWAELGDLSIYFEGIGYTEIMWTWNSKPSFFNKFWDELDENVRGNATELCYFENSWENNNLRYWTTQPPSENSNAPTAPPSAFPSSSPSQGPSVTVVESSASQALPSSSVMLMASIMLAMVTE